MPTYGYTVEYYDTSWHTVAAADVIDVSLRHRISANSDNPLAPGDNSEASGDVTVKLGAIPITSTAPRLRITYRVDGAPATALVGMATDIQDDSTDMETRLRVDGIKSHIANVRYASPMFWGRPVATATTNASSEDPLASGYAAGILNWIMWQADGRPLQQSGSYPNALFYYDFRDATIGPDTAWLVGDDSWQEAQKLAFAAGGRLYQAEDGTVRFRSVLDLAASGSGAILNESMYRAIERRWTWIQTAATLTCSYTPRRVTGWQLVLDDTNARQIDAGETLTLDLEPQYPVAVWGRFQGYATWIDARSVPYSGSSGITWNVQPYAQRLHVTLTNHGTEPLIVNRMTCQGRPLQPGTAGDVTVGSGTPTLAIGDNEFIQSRSQAERLATLLLQLYAPRPIYRLIECRYDAGRFMDVVVRVSSALYGLSDTPCLLVERSDDDTGLTSTYTVAPMSDLPRADQLFQIDAIYSGSDTREWGY